MSTTSKWTDEVVHPLKPIFNQESRILILGSFPSVLSRELAFYYANPTNRFWAVMSSLFEEEITDRTAFCLKHRIALWDVIASCQIRNSSDASISNVQVNDIQSVLDHSHIHTIFTTGKKSAELYRKYLHLPIQHIELPSTSAANAKMRLNDLVEAYNVIKYYAEKD